MSIDLLNNYTYEEPSSHVLLPAGEYSFSVSEVNEVEYSKGSGNPYIPILLEFTCPETGRTTTVYENLVFTEKAKWKIDSFLKSIWPTAEVGKRISWTDPTFLGWLKNKRGRAKLKVEPVKGKDYERNTVAEFLYGDAGSAAVKAAAKPAPAPAFVAPEVDDDNIPF